MLIGIGGDRWIERNRLIGIKIEKVGNRNLVSWVIKYVLSGARRDDDWVAAYNSRDEALAEIGKFLPDPEKGARRRHPNVPLDDLS